MPQLYGWAKTKNSGVIVAGGRQRADKSGLRDKGAGQQAGHVLGGESDTAAPQQLEPQARGLDDLIAPQVLTRIKGARVVVLCAEPGMGKSYIARGALRAAGARGWQTYTRSYQDLASDVACRRLTRCCLTVRKRLDHTGKALVVFDGMAPGDEAEAAREARAIEGLGSSDVQVLVCLRPEAEQLAERLPHALCLYAEDLLFRAQDQTNGVLDLTGGIPALAMAYRADWSAGELGSRGGPRYDACLQRLLQASLRDGLMREELRVRFAMMLLGQGTLEELRMVSGRCDGETLIWLQRDVPLLGVDARSQSFSCHGLVDDHVFERCSEGLHAFAAGEPGLVVRACAALAAREDVRRSAIVSRLCATERDHVQVCVSWGVSYVAAGEGRLVSEALRHARALGLDLGARGVMSAAAASTVVGTARQVDAAWESLASLRLTSSVEERLYRRVQLLGICRDSLRNPRQASRFLSSEPHDVVGLACLDHLKLVRLLAAGRFDECYAGMSNEMLLREPQSLPEAMVCDDLLLALSLCGGVPDGKERHLLAQAEAFFAHPGSKRVQAYHAAVASMPAILMSSGSTTGLVEEAASRAERAGDTFMHALCLAVCAVADVRSHALTRAHVRAEGAARLARALGEEYLASAVELVDAMALTMLGERGCLSAYCGKEGRPLGLALVGQVLACASSERPKRRPSQVIPQGMACPRNIVWLLNLLATGCEGAFGDIGDLVPIEWVELLRTIKYRQARGPGHGSAMQTAGGSLGLVKGGSSELGRGGQMEMRLVDDERGRIYVSVLGRFEVRCDGRLLPDAAFERRRARDLIAVLALTPGHKLYRTQAIEILWPQDEYFRGPRRLYEAVGEARKRLVGSSADDNPLLADRVQDTIGYDLAVVSCDVDDFEREARMVLSEDGDDFAVIEHAQRMERIYADGLDPRLANLGPIVAERSEALRSLYVDGVVAAGESALRLGKAKLAVRYGMDAHRLAMTREDAVMLTVRALKAAGRGFEIPDFYRRYAGLLMEAEGNVPSMALRRVVDLLMGGDPFGNGSGTLNA